MYVAHILRIELHEHVVYRLHRRRLLKAYIQETSISNSFVRERVFYHLNERFVSSRTRDIILSTTSSEPFRNKHLESDVPTCAKHRTFP